MEDLEKPNFLHNLIYFNLPPADPGKDVGAKNLESIYLPLAA